MFIYFPFRFSSLLLVLFTLSMGSLKLLSTEFEVYGIVQGVFFRKYTQQEATRLGLKGWCMNTQAGTVKGVLEGDANKVADMKTWLQTKGSPQSRIDKTEFKNEKEIQKLTFDDFKIKR
ncbi:Acylphosphatase-2-like Protein [Tribolium castaneum]|uniref:Acylphosphatase n=1 Tax=Tribolium castaneum TaxID=7070 RepID=A0A139WF64_TRICA|nr:PREDICTED: acylphosphatase-1-like [Tribolium castaneum]KYB26572.1 Acylphosphatase-2-like Protein [Tribolium castaneum]|eukprot:XP_008196261.1 PREDICTED: acylphosphatase-1-like [Tribolium castaneum]